MPSQLKARNFIVKTLGCKANWVDGQGVEARLRAEGWSALTEEEALATGANVDLCIVNSCTVTDEADRQSLKAARKLGARFLGAKVLFTGCAAEVDPERFAREKGIDWVVGNQDKERLATLLENATSEVGAAPSNLLGRATSYGELVSRHPMDREWPVVEQGFLAEANEGATHRTRAFLKIQDGCNSFCTYCIIPYGRGPARSLSIEAVVDQVNALVGQGYREVVLTGINIGEFGVDWAGERKVSDLVRAILSGTSLERLRVSSLDPSEIDGPLTKLMETDSRFCPHFHVSLQSPHGRVLRAMKRKYRDEDVVECLERVAGVARIPGGVFVGMDLITGFPGETDDEFAWTLERLRALPWTRLHVFPYSERSGTPATRLPGSVPPQERARRAKVLRALSLERMAQVFREAQSDYSRERDGWADGVLFESPVKGPDGSEGWWAGYTPNYQRVLVRSSEDLRNQLKRVRIQDTILDRVAGEACFLGSLS